MDNKDIIDNNNQIENNRQFLKIMETLGSQNAILERIEVQTVKTNGRITAVEIFQNKQKGFVATISIIGGIIGTVIAIAVKYFIGH